jgi:hypothetical protein
MGRRQRELPSTLIPNPDLSQVITIPVASRNVLLINDGSETQKSGDDADRGGQAPIVKSRPYQYFQAAKSVDLRITCLT